MYPCLIMAKKLSPGTSALGSNRLAKCSDTEDLPAPGGPVITIRSRRFRGKGHRTRYVNLRLGRSRRARVSVRWIVLQSFSFRFSALVDSVLRALQRFALGIDRGVGVGRIDPVAGVARIYRLGGVCRVDGLGVLRGVRGLGGWTIGARFLSRVHGHGYTPSSRRHSAEKMVL